jgi:hypothetical protein
MVFHFDVIPELFYKLPAFLYSVSFFCIANTATTYSPAN